jgi:hypothetical protein
MKMKQNNFTVNTIIFVENKKGSGGTVEVSK